MDIGEWHWRLWSGWMVSRTAGHYAGRFEMQAASPLRTGKAGGSWNRVLSSPPKDIVLQLLTIAICTPSVYNTIMITRFAGCLVQQLHCNVFLGSSVGTCAPAHCSGRVVLWE